MKSVVAHNQEGNELEVSRDYYPDRQAMLAALRVVLGLPRVPSPLARPLRDSEPEA